MVVSQLQEIEGALIGVPDEMGIPVATESDTTREAAETGDTLRNLNGVEAAILVYHNFEDMTLEYTEPKPFNRQAHGHKQT